ncbi:rhodanese-like domain-containing protein [Waterburya agarophytonicola K14]|uniref:Rhodanese-like domain-containing protein n=1 Tax=Waterburya agarophytonicola KI4 TaxID=2874699 RepID=A0A964BRA2_9CYAN|nr:rhodanese-like domain-containing protein [Waterburya agarophytonicola]MCC0178144.1 rhodanese-like domain-containing protein [Waterburya agarophytonicola KI4]
MTSIANSPPQVINLSPEEFTQLPQPPRLIDVRSKFEYGVFHAPNAINLSLPRILMNNPPWLSRYVLPQWFQELPEDEPIALICLTSHRSPIAAEQLTKAGFTEVYNVTGGMMEWKELGLPTCKGK